ncbi:Phosphoribosylamine--glycine ligase [Perkinsela sp. CCAP 1560/4]|nr:Phosphoribosylamine--glycine ligase [Perkinsela sp. CCAP 1560/4]|eukprot:KNH04383.1 Phosphoribosylamine--glycine ligase [Perkinsela sp. CCAP 1560/4]
MSSCFIPKTDEQLRGKTILAVFTSSEDRRVIYADIAERLNVRIIMVSTEEKTWADPFIWKWIIVSTVKIDVLVNEVVEKLQGISIDGVISFDEYGIYPCSVLATMFGKVVTPLSPKDIVRTQDKACFRAWCTEVHLTSPRAFQLHDECDLDNFIQNFLVQSDASDDKKYEFPLIVKPSPGAGSTLVTKCDSVEELKKCIEHSLATLPSEYAFLDKNCPTDGENGSFLRPSILIEEFIGGDEVDIDCLVHQGEIKYLLISDNFPSRTLPFFVESGGVAPSQLEEYKITAIRQLVVDFTEKIGPSLNGILHFEAKYDTNTQRAAVIEVNVRLGAAETFYLNTQTTGINIAIEYVKMALGFTPMRIDGSRAVPVEHPAVFTSTVNKFLLDKTYVSINFPPVHCRLFQHTTDGMVENVPSCKCPQNTDKFYRIRKQCVPESVLNDKHYVAHRLYFNVGYRIQPLYLNTRALGWLLCWGTTAEEAWIHLERLSKMIVFEAIEDNLGEI